MGGISGIGDGGIGHPGEPDGIDVVFDGRCGVCTRAADWLHRRDRRGRIRLHPAQRPGALERFGLSEEAARASVWAFERGGAGGSPAGYGGAAAVNRALDAAFGLRFFLPLYGVPGVRWAQDRAYRWVAEHRHRLPGATPWCEDHPRDCGGPGSP